MVDVTSDRLPRAGERNGVFYSMAYSGNGTQMSTILAEVMDGRADRNPWKGFAWPAIPGHVVPPWFLPLVGAYYRLKDKLPRSDSCPPHSRMGSSSAEQVWLDA